MSQVTGKKVAVTPMPTPTGTSGAIIDSFNTQDDQTVNAPSIHIVKDALTTINDNLAQTPITVGGITMSTIDEKLNFLCNGGGNGKITVLTNHQLNLYAMLLENNQMPTIEISMVIQHSGAYTDTGHGTYIDVTCTGQGSGTSGWTKIDIYAKFSGKYAIKGFSTNEDRVVTVNANELIISVSDMAGHNLPALVSNESVATIQYLGNN